MESIATSWIRKAATFVQNTLQQAEGGHDWWHTYRVWKMAATLGRAESVDMTVVELAALLHDVADSKFHDGNEEIGPATAAAFLQKEKVPADISLHVVQIVRHMSYKNSLEAGGFTSREMQVVQDADRLDAIGAIGIARAFSYGGYNKRLLYDPAVPPHLHMTKAQYKNSTAPTINHFYEKLLLLKDTLHTAAGRQMAAERHAFMEAYLQQFYKEWEGLA